MITMMYGLVLMRRIPSSPHVAGILCRMVSRPHLRVPSPLLSVTSKNRRRPSMVTSACCPDRTRHAEHNISHDTGAFECI